VVILSSKMQKVLHVIILMIIILNICALPSQAQATSTDFIYERIYQNYPDEIQTLNRYGATESNIKYFISSFVIILEETENLDQENFENETVNAILSLYISGNHIEVFDAVFNGWNLDQSSLMNALNNGGTVEVMRLLPQSFKEIGRLVTKILLPSPDINEDGIVDLYDLVIISKFNQCEAFQSGIPLGLDQNNDGIINIADLMKVALQVGNFM